MKAAGTDVIAFSVGEPDFNTPEPICEAAIASIRKGYTKYTASAGIPELRTAIAEHLRSFNGIAADPSEVIVSCGAKQSVYQTLQVLINPGDEVIFFAPYWMTYRDQVNLAGGKVVEVATSAANGFAPSMDDLRAAITDRTRAIVVNSPSNPTGGVYSRQVMKEIAATALRHGLWVISDEIYEHLIYDGERTSMAALGKEIAEQTITISGFSKTYSMTGWRVGYAHAPNPVATALSNLQDQVTSNPTSFAQYGALQALQTSADEIAAMRESFRARRDLMVKLLQEIPGVTVDVPAGAFYVFPDVSTYLSDSCDDVQLVNELLEEVGVATVPGSVFSGPGHIRLSYAVSPDEIERGVARIGEALQRRAK
ncbi:MAG TPA: aspartate aminotransferase [Armatimonadetes bacterium]|nr:aspartate aminotransferase [Armatimonadota bacterium]